MCNKSDFQVRFEMSIVRKEILFNQIQEGGNVSLSQLYIYIYIYIMINFIWLHVSTRNESSSGHLNLLL
jgi:hypothetical protein